MMAKTDTVSTRRARGGAVSISTRITLAKHQRKHIDSVAKCSVELIDVIETERARLMKAQAILNCALVAMECENTAGATYYPDALQVAQELLNQSIDQLDSLRLRPMIQALENAASPHAENEIPELDPNNEHEVRDSENVIYIASPSLEALS
ncbi:MAG: hypothetical protein QM808_07130 [Steroidobacteraceae bacterium]